MLAKQQGFDVFVSDKGTIPESFRNELSAMGVPFEEGQHSESLILNATEVIKSPGIPDNAPLVIALKSNGIPVISEIEFAARYAGDAKMICITGTNGKTTTTSLTYHILKQAGLNVAVGGNIGTSLARLVATGSYDYYVLEISSFQLDGMFQFHADIAVLTNITPDHLDRYNNHVDEYIASKFRIAQNQQPGDWFIYCADDELTKSNLSHYPIKAQALPISYETQPHPGAYVSNGILYANPTIENTNTFTMHINELSLRGRHNGYNSMAAAIIAQVLTIRKETIRESLMSFQNVEHRLESVISVGGVEYINDSKATNVNSAWYALESMDRPTIWIAGGVDKGNDYAILKDLVKEKVRIIICLGADNRKLHEAFGQSVDMIVNTSSMPEAVHVASQLSRPGESVLLSPACASFDLFKNYEDRGRQFKKAVKEL